VTLEPSQVPWLPIAARVLVGEFDRATKSVREAITIGLRGIRHEDCRRAVERLGPDAKHPASRETGR
jgi:hypothetical protein